MSWALRLAVRYWVWVLAHPWHSHVLILAAH